MAHRKTQRAVQSLEHLGLDIGATPQEIRAAYRRLIQRWHPDRHRGDVRAENKSKQLNAAFTTLKSLSAEQLARLKPTVRARPKPKRHPVPRTPWTPPRAPARDPLRQHLARRRTTTPSRRRGRDVLAEVVVSTEEVHSGAYWQFDLPTCTECAGWGAAFGAPFQVCADCRSHGARVAAPSLDLRTCRACNGRGSFFTQVCPGCGGRGDTSRYLARCRIPPGMAPGCLGVLEGLGHPGARGAAPGNLYLSFWGGAGGQPLLDSKWLCQGFQ